MLAESAVATPCSVFEGGILRRTRRFLQYRLLRLALRNPRQYDSTMLHHTLRLGRSPAGAV